MFSTPKEKERTHFGIKVLESKRQKEFYSYTRKGKIHIEKSAVKKLGRNGLKTLIMHERFHQRWDTGNAQKFVNGLTGIVMCLSLWGAAVLVYLIYIFLNFGLPNVKDSWIAWWALCALLIYFVIVIINTLFVRMYSKRIEEAAADLYSAKEVGKGDFVRGFERRYTEYPRYGNENTRCGRIKHYGYFFKHRYKQDRIKLVEET